jgi:hypothetical protein
MATPPPLENFFLNLTPKKSLPNSNCVSPFVGSGTRLDSLSSLLFDLVIFNLRSPSAGSLINFLRSLSPIVFWFCNYFYYRN